MSALPALSVASHRLPRLTAIASTPPWPSPSRGRGCGAAWPRQPRLGQTACHGDRVAGRGVLARDGACERAGNAL